MEAVVLDRGYAPALPDAPHSERWLEDVRRDAFVRFEELGFPNAKLEAWRFTGIQPITSTSWAPAPANAAPAVAPWGGSASSRLVFVNGRLAPGLSSPAPAGVRATGLADALAAEPALVRASLTRLAPYRHNAFAALNTASFADAACVLIAPGAAVAAPLTLVFVSVAGGELTVSHPRILIVAGERSQASIVQVFEGSGRYLTDAVTEIAVGPGASLEHTLLQRESESACHVHFVAATVARSGRLVTNNVSLGSALARTDISAALMGEGAEVAMNGLFLGRGAQHIDNHTTIDHAKPHTSSRELYKGVMDGASRGVFHGTILVRPDAQKTDAIQTNKNLLLSREALVNSTPALQIFADDVKCKHGSTTGQLDESALFYLRARGIGQAEARAMLTRAFAEDAAARISDPGVRAEIDREIDARLAGTRGEAA
ncbi:MAG TPA: Fe-S cluster assembly protein SufD [Thermoanaerobaculia bacterium]|jgi:Fe-S cluster assembly protein SufD|nr:Fe-S cluster assembly protein SufD [Thermoanaerobaculia bacterium]